MGSIVSSVSALAGGANNNANYTASGANLVQPTTADQTNQAFNTSQSGLNQQQQLVNAIQSQNGLGNQTSVYNQLQGVANGTGANPAQAQLAQATGANTANQAALMGSQRGSSQNVGLMARQAAQQGAANQQSSIGQAATLQATQSQNALNQMGSLANTQAANQISSTQNLNTDAQSEQSTLLNALGQQNSQNVQMQSNVNNANEGMASTNATNTANLVGGLMKGASGAAAIAAAKGGEVKKDEVVPPKGKNPVIYPQHFQDLASLYGGGDVDFRQGGTVPGNPKVQKDSPKNDVVPAKLSPKEIVLPISVTTSKDAPAAAAKFVAETLAKKGGNKAGHEKEFKEALKKAISGRRVSK